MYSSQHSCKFWYYAQIQSDVWLVNSRIEYYERKDQNLK